MGKVLPLRRVLRRRGRKWSEQKRLKNRTGVDFSYFYHWLQKSSAKIDEREGYDTEEVLLKWDMERLLKTRQRLNDREVEIIWQRYKKWMKKPEKDSKTG